MDNSKTNQELSKSKIWTGRILSFLGATFMLFDSVLHIMNPKVVTDSMTMLGYPNIAPILGIISLLCLILYFIPRTSVLGAIFLTGYLGGAVATNVRIQAPLFSNILFPIYIAIFLWLGLWFRDAKLRELVPLKK